MQGIGSSPMFNSIVAQGEDALLQNSAATGGVRGGNTAGLLAQYRPQMLQQQIQQQMQQLGGLASMGLGAAGQQAGIQAGFAGQQAGLEGQLGDIQAAGTLGEYNTQRGFVTDAVGMGLQFAGIPGGGLF